jgi:hypothetical protein
MKNLARFLAITLCSGALWADSVLTGVIKDVEVGDYYHIVLKDNKGKERSFFVGNHKSFAKLVDQPASYKGKKVRLHWHSVEKNIPEAGGKMKIDEATSMELVK